MTVQYLSHLFFVAPTYDEAARPTPATTVAGSEDQAAEMIHVTGRSTLDPVRAGDDPIAHLGRPIPCRVLAWPRHGLPKPVATVWVRAEAYPTTAHVPPAPEPGRHP